MNHQHLIRICIFEQFQGLLFSDLSGPLTEVWSKACLSFINTTWRHLENGAELTWIMKFYCLIILYLDVSNMCFYLNQCPKYGLPFRQNKQYFQKKNFSVSGNRTPVSRVTGGDTHHYTNTDS